jgi:hypothetical protein
VTGRTRHDDEWILVLAPASFAVAMSDEAPAAQSVSSPDTRAVSIWTGRFAGSGCDRHCAHALPKSAWHSDHQPCNSCRYGYTEHALFTMPDAGRWRVKSALHCDVPAITSHPNSLRCTNSV